MRSSFFLDILTVTDKEIYAYRTELYNGFKKYKLPKRKDVKEIISYYSCGSAFMVFCSIVGGETDFMLYFSIFLVPLLVYAGIYLRYLFRIFKFKNEVFSKRDMKEDRRRIIHSRLPKNISYETDNLKVDANYEDAIVTYIDRFFSGCNFRADIETKHISLSSYNSYEISLRNVVVPDINSPDHTTEVLAQVARLFLISKLYKSKLIILKNIYISRNNCAISIIADVWADGKNVGDELINAGLAKPHQC